MNDYRATLPDENEVKALLYLRSISLNSEKKVSSV